MHITRRVPSSGPAGRALGRDEDALDRRPVLILNYLSRLGKIPEIKAAEIVKVPRLEACHKRHMVWFNRLSENRELI